VIRAQEKLIAGGARARPVLLELLASEDGVVRMRASGAVSALKRDALPFAAAILRLRADKEAETRRFVCLILGNLGSSVPEAAEVLCALMEDEDVRVSATAAYGYWLTTGDAEHAAKKLVDLMETNRGAAMPIFMLPDFGAKALPALEAGLRSKHPLMVRHCCSVVSRLRGRAAPPTDLLHELVEGGPKEARDAVLSALACIPDRSPRAVRIYLEFARTGENAERLSAVTGLATSAPHEGQTAAEVTKVVLRALQDDWFRVRVRAALVLHRVAAGTEPQILALAALLNDEEPQVLVPVVRALEKFGARAKCAVPLLRAFLKKHDSPLMRTRVLRVIQTIES